VVYEEFDQILIFERVALATSCQCHP